MYNEYETVLKSIECVKNSDIAPYVIVIHSSNSSDNKKIKDLVDVYRVLPNIEKEVPKQQVPAYSLCRNYGLGFSILYKNGFEYDLLVALTGDTLITDTDSFKRRLIYLENTKNLALVSQAIGQYFNAATDDIENGKQLNRFQFKGITDFMPQLFFLDGKFAKEKKLFSTIKITNKYTSEQCLGDELLKKIDNNFFEDVGILNHNNTADAYAYNDGVVLQYKN
jgi:hypothetical protein